MKKTVGLFVLLFAFACHANPPPKMLIEAPSVQLNGQSIMDILEAIPKEEPAAAVVCKSDPKQKNSKCVPKYRFSDEVDEHSTKKMIAWIDAANSAGADAILLEINTPGGEVWAGFELARAIEDSEAPVTCVVDGQAASMGFYLLQSCEHRYMTRRSRLMAHEPGQAVSFGGHPNDWQSIADNLKTVADTFAYWCWHRLNIPLKEYHAKIDGNKQWWFLADEAKKIGAIDGYADTVKKLHRSMLHAK